jgi:hypothetical protein
MAPLTNDSAPYQSSQFGNNDTTTALATLVSPLECATYSVSTASDQTWGSLSVSTTSASDTMPPRGIASLPAELVNQIFEYLPLNDQFRMKYVCRAWWHLADDCEIITIANGVSVDAFTTLDDHGEIKEEYEHLDPVIGKNPNRRILPKNCIVFEPNYEGHRYRYHLRQYTPSQITIHWPGLATPYRWTLPKHTNSPSRYQPFGGRATMKSHQKTPFTIYDCPHPFLGENFPLRVFYKTDRDDCVTVHAVSIPRELLEVIIHRQKGRYYDSDSE